MAVSEKLVNRLNDLLMMDHDAADAYEEAITRMSSDACKKKLREHQGDHDRHIAELKACIAGLGAPPKDHRDLKGVLLKGMTALQSMAGDEMALKAMQTNERLTNKACQDALDDRTMPDDVREIVARHLADEARHLEWIGIAVSRRLWESASPAAQP